MNKSSKKWPVVDLIGLMNRGDPTSWMPVKVYAEENHLTVPGVHAKARKKRLEIVNLFGVLLLVREKK